MIYYYYGFLFVEHLSYSPRELITITAICVTVASRWVKWKVCAPNKANWIEAILFGLDIIPIYE